VSRILFGEGVLIGALIGVTLAWLWWRLPVHLRTRRTRKLRKQVLDMRRIEAAFTAKDRKWIPNPRELRVTRIPYRDRIMEGWQVWKARWDADLDPWTPERAAEEAYRQALVEVT
jgi:hypothetical protein